MVILMSNDKPMNAMYGQKVKLDLDKIKNRKPDDEETPKEVFEEPVVENVANEPVVEEVSDDVSQEPAAEEVAEPEEVVEEIVDEPEEDFEEVINEPVVEEVIDDPVINGVIDDEEPVAEEKPKAKSDKSLDDLKKKLKEKDEKLSNQSSELNYLTNKIIPKLKKENAELNKLKYELTDALEKTTRKYFDQLDINADLSNKIGKLGAESAVNKVRADKLESEADSIREELEAKIEHYKEELAAIDVTDIKEENSKLSSELDEVKEKLADSRKENVALSEEVDQLRAELIELGNYKEEVDNKNKKEIEGYKEEISSLKTQLKLKESSYDKLSNDSSKTISDLRKQVSKLEEDLEKESNKGLFNRFK
jgi:DNA repair exonuclease SbcCD ATPase subunit